MTITDQDQELNQINRGKRAKRHRLMSPFTLAINSGSSSGSGEKMEGESSRFMTDDNTEEEEEDMANCLILLARGSHDNRKSPPAIGHFEVVGLGDYQCKPCGRCFSSFQALGGHRASHKKPKAVDIENKMAMCGENQFNETSTSLSVQTGNGAGLRKSNHKVHECLVCAAEFSSGQALGGHMRRHRTIVSSSGGSGPSTALSLDSSNSHEESRRAKKPRNRSINLHLDLNLPVAAEDNSNSDRKEVNFPFGSKEQMIGFSAYPLDRIMYANCRLS